MMEVCTYCKGKFDTLGRGVLIQEDADLRAMQAPDDKDSWDWLPMGANGMHYMLLHFDCWNLVWLQLKRGSRSAGFMFYLGEISDLREVTLCLN